MSTPKIIFLSPVGYFKGGAEKSLLDLLQNPSITPLLVVPEEGELSQSAKNHDITAHILPFGKINQIRRPFSFLKALGVITDLIRSAKELHSIAKSEEAEIVHSNGLKAHIINCVRRRMYGGKAIVHIRDIPFTLPEKIVWRAMHLMADKMVLVSRACWPGATLPSKACVIHNGITVSENRKNHLNDIISLGFLGRLHPSKGLHLLISWIEAAQTQGIKTALSIRGTFSDDSPEYEAKIKDQIEAAGLEEIIEFTGHIRDIERLYDGIDIVVVPSQVPDPLPRSVMEAMAFGIPVFGYPAGGITEMIEHERTGYLISDSDGFCAALKEICSDTKKKETLITNAKNKIKERFTVEQLHDKLAALYQELL